MVNFWGKNYNKHENTMHEKWNTEEERYKREYNEIREKVNNGEEIEIIQRQMGGEEVEQIKSCRAMHRELFEMIAILKKEVVDLQGEIVTEERVKRCLNKIKKIITQRDQMA